ncbi:hypothetical protein ACFLSQ_00060 [Bacteroidota bacterium]
MLFLKINCIFLSVEPDFDFIYLLIIFLIIISIGAFFFAIKGLIDSLKFSKLKKMLINDYNQNRVLNYKEILSAFKQIFSLQELKNYDFKRLIVYLNNLTAKIDNDHNSIEEKEGFNQSLINCRDELIMECNYDLLPENLSNIFFDLTDDENKKNDNELTNKMNELAYAIFDNINRGKKFKLAMGGSIFILIVVLILILYYVFEII